MSQEDIQAFVSHLAIEALQKKMKDCIQYGTVNVYQHGLAVRAEWFKILNYINSGDRVWEQAFRCPRWLKDYRLDIQETMPPFAIMSSYVVYHDCGKPFCQTEDTGGKIHFPDHAKMSGTIWRETQHPHAERIASLMERDMDIHLLKPEGVEEFAKFDDCVGLLLAGLAEIHANCEMFGGPESQGFKIKYAQIDRRGKAVCQLVFGEPERYDGNQC